MLLRLERDEWPKWLAAAGFAQRSAQGAQFSDIGLLIQAPVVAFHQWLKHELADASSHQQTS